MDVDEGVVMSAHDHRLARFQAAIAAISASIEGDAGYAFALGYRAGVELHLAGVVGRPIKLSMIEELEGYASGLKPKRGAHGQRAQRRTKARAQRRKLQRARRKG